MISQFARRRKLLTTAAALAVVACLALWLIHGSEQASPRVPTGSGGVRQAEGTPPLLGGSRHATGQPRATVTSPLPDTGGGEPPALTPWDLVVAGFVVTEEGEVAVDASVRATGAAGEDLGSVLSDDRGRFRMRLSLSGPPRLICLSANSAGRSSAPLKSLPWYMTPKRPPAVPPSAVLILRPSASIEGVVVQEDGSPAAGATVTVVRQHGTDSAPPMPGWEVASFAEEASVALTSNEGRFSLAVRPGSAVVRASLGPARSEAVRVRVPRAANERVGTLQLSSQTFDAHLRIIGASGVPASGAWVQLEDRTLRYGNLAADSTLPTLKADTRGQLSLEGLLPSDFPLVLAAGTATSGPVQICLDSAPTEEVVVRLPGRPGLMLRLPSALCQGVVGSPFDHAWYSFEQVDPPAPQGLQEMRTPAEMISGVLQEDVVLVDSNDACTGHAYLATEGKYRVTLGFRGVSPVDLVVRASRGVPEVYDLVLPPGRWVQLRSELPVGWHGSFRCQWLAHGDRVAPAFDVSADSLRSGVSCFAPEGVNGVMVSHVQPSLLDVAVGQPAEVPAPGGVVNLHLHPTKPLVPVRIGLSREGLPIRAADWPIQVIPVDRDGVALGTGVTVRTGADGWGVVSTSADRLQVVSLQRLRDGPRLVIERPDAETAYLVPIW